jgi:hypothetical protein
MQKTLKTLIRISLPFLIGTALFFTFFLSQPLDQFCFRHWEAFTSRSDTPLLPGPEYPNLFMQRVEVGDLAPYTKNSVAKETSWQTDSFGYRQHISECKDYPAVVSGDSFVVGCGLKENEMLSARYEKVSGNCTLSMGGGNFPETIANLKFRNIHPRVIYLAKVERYIHENWQDGEIERIRSGRKFRYQIGWNPSAAVSAAGTLLDRASSLDFFQFRKSKGLMAAFTRLFEMKENIEELTDYSEKPFENKKMLFHDDENAFVPYTPAQLSKVADVLVEYQKMAKEIGAKLIFIPIPNKEVIYPELVPWTGDYHFLEDLQEVFSSRHIDFIDLVGKFKEFRSQNPNALIYQTDDTHWNEAGVSLTASLMVKSKSQAE